MLSPREVRSLIQHFVSGGGGSHHHPGGWGARADSHSPGLRSLLLMAFAALIFTRRSKAPDSSSGHGTLPFLLGGRQVAHGSPSPHSRNPKWTPLRFIRIRKHLPHSPFGRPTAGRRCFPGSPPGARCSHLGMLSFQASLRRCQHWQHLRGHIQKWACLDNQYHVSLFLYFSYSSPEIS